MGTLWQDVRCGIRMLGRNPGFAAVVVIVLGLGVSASTAMFSLVNGVMLRPLPYEDPGRLVLVWGANPRLGLGRTWVSGPDFVEWQKHQTCFDHIAAFRNHEFAVKHEESLHAIAGARASASFFDVMKVKTVLGRTFRQDEETPGVNRVAVISHRYWRDRLGRDPTAIGRTLIVDEEPVTIIGVVAEGFDFPEGSDLWLPVNLDPAAGFNSRDNFYYTVIGRLKPGLTLQQGEQSMKVLAARIAADHPETNEGHTIWLVRLLDHMVGNVKWVLYMLLGAVTFVLLIACASIANLLLVRAVARDREVAVRAALGASRGRLVLQAFVESMILSLLGLACGLLVLFWSFDSLLALSPWAIPRKKEIHIDLNVLVFALLITVATSLAFGVGPALRSLRLEVNAVLASCGSKLVPTAGHQRFRSLMIVGDVALSLVLLMGVGLLLRSFINLRNPDFLGFNARNLLVASVLLPQAEYPSPSQASTRIDEFGQRLRSIPGVASIGQTSVFPFRGSSKSPIYIAGRTEGLPAASLWIDRENVDSHYFDTLGIRLLRGRSFSERDSALAPHVAVIDETLAHRFWPDEDPVGQEFKIGTARTDTPWLTVVGVAKTIRPSLFAGETFGKFYLPCAQWPEFATTLLIRTKADSLNVADTVRDLFIETFGSQTSFSISTFEDTLASSFVLPGFVMRLLAVFAGSALLITTIGLYGVVACSVAQRTREFGIRVALGAVTSDVLHLLLRQGLVLTLLGIGIGWPIAFGVTRLLKGLLVGVVPTDLLTFVSAAFLLIAATALACYLPARRAARIDPMVALRYE